MRQNGHWNFTVLGSPPGPLIMPCSNCLNPVVFMPWSKIHLLPDNISLWTIIPNMDKLQVWFHFPHFWPPCWLSMGMSHSCSEKQSSEKNKPTNRWQKNKTPNARDLEQVGVEKSLWNYQMNLIQIKYSVLRWTDSELNKSTFEYCLKQWSGNASYTLRKALTVIIEILSQNQT